MKKSSKKKSTAKKALKSVSKTALVNKEPQVKQQAAKQYLTRDGNFQQVPNPEHLSPDERVAIIAVIKSRVGGPNQIG